MGRDETVRLWRTVSDQLWRGLDVVSLCFWRFRRWSFAGSGTHLAER